MPQRNNIKNILKDQSGASLALVLGVMLLLMAIGTSVLVAASANVGLVSSQREHSQIILLDESIHKSIMYSLQHDPEDPDFLSNQLAYAIYKANDPKLDSYNPEGLSDIKLVPELSNDVDLINGDITVDITLSFLEQNVIITESEPAIYTPSYDDGGVEIVDGETLDIEREPKTATVNATMIVTVKITQNGKVTMTRALYQYTGGILTDDLRGSLASSSEDVTGEMVFEEEGYGEWRLIKHESIESVDFEY